MPIITRTNPDGSVVTYNRSVSKLSTPESRARTQARKDRSTAYQSRLNERKAARAMRKSKGRRRGPQKQYQETKPDKREVRSKDTVFNHLSAPEVIKLISDCLWRKWTGFIFASSTPIDDYTQEMVIHLLRLKYDPNKSKPSTFINMVVNSKMITIRNRFNEKLNSLERLYQLHPDFCEGYAPPPPEKLKIKMGE